MEPESEPSFKWMDGYLLIWHPKIPWCVMMWKSLSNWNVAHFPYHPWDERCIYLHEWFIFYGKCR